MSECMIVRRGGGGGEGFDPNGAVLKVVTSTNCTVLVTGTGYSETHQQADGFTRSGDANVTEHFFSIPASAFGTITVKATNTYGDNTKTITVNTAGKSYELLCGGINIILNSTFGLQDDLELYNSSATYDDRNKRILLPYEVNDWVFKKGIMKQVIPVAAYTKITCTAASSSGAATLYLRDRDNINLATMDFFGADPETKTVNITNKHYDTVGMYFNSVTVITQIVLS